MRHIAYIGLGSNLDDPRGHLQRAFVDLRGVEHIELEARSSLYLSAPVGCLDQPDYVNAVARISTDLDPKALLDALLRVEERHGRERIFLHSPRTLDLDILLFDDMQLHEPGLVIPHPRMHNRAFVLTPLLELAPGVVIPGVGRADAALRACQDQVLERIPDAV
jgi:2-amino-4-hydroxy-6-hydroxymethyldihydropteridine diphosphokinase